MTNTRKWIAVAGMALALAGCAKHESPPAVQITGDPAKAIPPSSSTTSTTTTAAPPTTLYYGG